MGMKDKERRIYSKKFKVETTALAQKHENPVRQIARVPRLTALPRTRTVPMPRDCSSTEGNQGVAGGGVKLRFTGNPKKAVEL
jgi:hypothetical protein